MPTIETQPEKNKMGKALGSLLLSAKHLIKRNEFWHGKLLGLYTLSFRIAGLLIEKKGRLAYYHQIEDIKKKKKLVLDLQSGGIGDCLAYSTLPRLLKNQFDTDFYLSQKSLSVIRQKETLSLCFELNPYFRGVSDDTETFVVKNFESDKSWPAFLFDKGGESVVERFERQFGLSGGRGRPEIYYKPEVVERYKKVVLIDKNTISGEKFGWKFKAQAFEDEAKKYLMDGTAIEEVCPSNQTLFEFVDMIYSCQRYVGTFSGGASIAACFDKPFSVIFPYNAINGSNFPFVYKKSNGVYLQ